MYYFYPLLILIMGSGSLGLLQDEFQVYNFALVDFELTIDRSYSHRDWSPSIFLCSNYCLLEGCHSFFINSTESMRQCQLYWHKSEEMSIPIIHKSVPGSIEIWTRMGQKSKEKLILYTEPPMRTYSTNSTMIRPLTAVPTTNTAQGQWQLVVESGPKTIHLCATTAWSDRSCNSFQIGQMEWQPRDPLPLVVSGNHLGTMTIGEEVVVVGAGPNGLDWDPVTSRFINGIKTLIYNKATKIWRVGDRMPFDIFGAVTIGIDNRYGLVFGGGSQIRTDSSVVMLYDHLFKNFTIIYEFGEPRNSGVCLRTNDDDIDAEFILCTSGVFVDRNSFSTYIFNLTSWQWEAKPSWDLPPLWQGMVNRRWIDMGYHLDGVLTVVGEDDCFEFQPREFSAETNSFWHPCPLELASGNSVIEIEAEYITF